MGNRVQASRDGVTWMIQASAMNNQWSAVAFGERTFVAVGSSGLGDRVQTSF